MNKRHDGSSSAARNEQMLWRVEPAVVTTGEIVDAIASL